MILGACVLALGHSSCLKLNLDYGYPVNQQDPREEDPSGDSSSTPSQTGGGAAASADTQGDFSGQTSSSAGQVTSASAETSTDGGTDSSDPSTSELSTDSTNSSSGSIPPTEPGSGSRWIPITVQNPANNRSIPLGASVGLTIDHAQLVTEGANALGDDLRVYSLREGSRTQLHRVLDPQSGWGRSDTKIWFNLDKALNTSETEANVYHIVLDSNTNSPAQDPQQVFLIYDDFNTANPTLAGWNVNTSGADGTFLNQVDNGHLVISATPNASNEVKLSIHSADSFSVPGVAVEAMVSFEMTGDLDGCTRETVLDLSSAGTFYERALWERRDNRFYFVNRTDGSSLDSHRMNTDPLNGDFRRRKFIWAGSSLSVHTNEFSLDNVVPENTSFTTPGAGPLVTGFRVSSDGALCRRTSRVSVDWILARSVGTLADIGATLQLGDAFIEP